MKWSQRQILLLPLLIVFVQSAQAAAIIDGRVNTEKGVIELDVMYTGGCRDHEFRLEFEPCIESFPVRCGAMLIEDSKGDLCKALIHETIELSLKEAGLSDPQFSGAVLTIKGDGKNPLKLQLP